MGWLPAKYHIHKRSSQLPEDWATTENKDERFTWDMTQDCNAIWKQAHWHGVILWKIVFVNVFCRIDRSWEGFEGREKENHINLSSGKEWFCRKLAVRLSREICWHSSGERTGEEVAMAHMTVKLQNVFHVSAECFSCFCFACGNPQVTAAPKIHTIIPPHTAPQSDPLSSLHLHIFQMWSCTRLFQPRICLIWPEHCYNCIWYWTYTQEYVWY